MLYLNDILFYKDSNKNQKFLLNEKGYLMKEQICSSQALDKRFRNPL